MMLLKRCLSYAAFTLIAFLAFAQQARPVEISGKVALSGEPVADVVISIEGLRAEGSTDGTVYVIDHRSLNFVPHVLVVPVGSTVQFKNSDGMPCRIYSISPAGIFVLRGQDGRPMTIKFDRPGVIEVRCADHARIHAYVVVKENSYFALTDAKGRYEISQVPPGRYTLQAWYEGRVVKRKTIKIGSENLTIDLRAARPHPSANGEKTLDPTSLDSAAVWPANTSVDSTHQRKGNP